jgi:hypothetical protein
MDTEYWLTFYLTDNRHFYCQKCKEGKLLRVNDFQFHKANISLREIKISGILKCNNISCNEVYSICGKRIEVTQIKDNGIDTPYFETYFKYEPEFISPPLEIIELKNKYPRTVNDALYESFKLFFSDNEACANKIRIALEFLLDELGVDQLDKKGENLALGVRIEKYKEVDEKNSNLMKATKIIGNYGSHREKVSRQDVLDGYELLKAVLDDLYDNESEKIRLKAELINKNKKPISKIKE